jgi:hypothetical protein
VASFAFRVHGYPPIKNEAKSLFSADHAQVKRVIHLLTTAQHEAEARGFRGFGAASVGLEVQLACPRGAGRGDATNFLGGIADVLEDKTGRGTLAHLGELATFGLYDNDSQIEEVHYTWTAADAPAYRVRLWTCE